MQSGQGWSTGTVAVSALPAGFTVDHGRGGGEADGAGDSLGRPVVGVYVGHESADALSPQPGRRDPGGFPGVALALMRRGEYPRDLRDERLVLEGQSGLDVPTARPSSRRRATQFSHRWDPSAERPTAWRR